MSKFLGKLFGDAPKTSAQAPPKAFTIQVDPSK